MRRLGTSVQLPWFVGVAALVVLGLASILLVGRDRDDNLAPHGALVTTQERLSAQAEGIRRSGNEDIDDLAVLGRLIASGVVAPQHALASALAAQPRWSRLAVITAQGKVTAQVGAVTPEMRAAAASEGRYRVIGNRTSPTIVISSREDTAASPFTVVGEAVPEVLLNSLDLADVQATWMLDAGGAVVAATTTDAAPTGIALSRDQTTSLVYSGERGRPVVIVNAPISGDGPVGRAGFRLVTRREVAPAFRPATLQLPGRIYGISLLLLTALLAWGLRLGVIRPVLALERESERVAFGDLRQPVPVGAYDEIGRTARALERLRVALLRRRAARGDEPGPLLDAGAEDQAGPARGQEGEVE